MTSRAMMLDSATAGQPGRPNRPDHSPSWQQALGPASVGSWLCWLTTPPNERTYSRARRMTRASPTQRPSSEKTVTRARERCMRPSSASCSPSRPCVTAPTGWTSTRPTRAPRSRIRSAASAVSVTGVVLAIARTAVKPPTAAACDPDSMVSASSRPGSRKCVCRSTRPGRRTSPSASSRVMPDGALATAFGPTSRTTPSVTKTSAAWPPRIAAPVMRRLLMPHRLPRRPASDRARSSGPRHRRRPGPGSGSARHRRPRR